MCANIKFQVDAHILKLRLQKRIFFQNWFLTIIIQYVIIMSYIYIFTYLFNFVIHQKTCILFVSYRCFLYMVIALHRLPNSSCEFISLIQFKSTIQLNSKIQFDDTIQVDPVSRRYELALRGEAWKGLRYRVDLN